jgi:hypothetical protein
VISKRNGKEEENRGMVSLAHIITQNGIRIRKRERERERDTSPLRLSLAVKGVSNVRLHSVVY